MRMALKVMAAVMLLQHFRVVKKMHGLARGAAGAVRLTRNLETSPNLLRPESGYEDHSW